MPTTSAMNMSWEPSSITWRTRQQIERGDSPTKGALTCLFFMGVRCIASHLLLSLPERTPHQSVARASSSVVRLMTNSPVRRMMS